MLLIVVQRIIMLKTMNFLLLFMSLYSCLLNKKVIFFVIFRFLCEFPTIFCYSDPFHEKGRLHEDDLDPNPPKWIGSERIQIHNTVNQCMHFLGSRADIFGQAVVGLQRTQIMQYTSPSAQCNTR